MNREIYIEALLSINEEYEYNNYFLSKEACIQILADMCAGHRLRLEREETETDEDVQETAPKRILNWLLGAKWLRKVEDYTTMTTNIVIPDYAAILIDAFLQLASEPMEDTQIYIQNVYATLFSFKNDSRMNLSMLKTALVNTKKLNKALQDMLHNMDKFFERLLDKQNYAELLKEHLEGYVQEVVNKKYHILKTSDNFYIYKMDIRRCLKEMREDEAWVERIRARQAASAAGVSGAGAFGTGLSGRAGSGTEPDVLDLIDQIERGFEMIERRIANMDREHSKYVRATVSRLNYLLSEESDRHGLLIQLLNKLGEPEEEGEMERRLQKAAERMNLGAWEVLAESPLYRRRRRKNFLEELEPEEEDEELSREEILRLNKIRHRFKRRQVEEFIEEKMQDGCLDTRNLTLSGDEEFEKLILAYDLCMRKNSSFEVTQASGQVEDGAYAYPAMLFVKRKGKTDA